MGIDARIVVYAPDEAAAKKACEAAFNRIAKLDSIMSDYRKDSELMRLCDQAGGPPVWVSGDLYKVLAFGQKVSRDSRGAFDMSVGPLVGVWRAARRAKALPDPVTLSNARKLVGYRSIRLDPKNPAVRLTKKGMRLDLGGIAKGYAADEAQKVLRAHGVRSALVEMGGDIVVSDAPPGQKGWTISVPNAGSDKGPREMTFKNCAISTSGDTEQFFEAQGKRYSHVVDPRTGWALTNRVQATIVAPTGLEADPWSTALTVLAPRERAAFLRRIGNPEVYVRELKG
jgi:thiamine biosynthesis lipoprotein